MEQQREIQAIQKFDEAPLHSNSQTVSHQPGKFVIDFKGIFPQFDPNNQATLTISHKTVVLDSYAVKEFQKALNDNIEKYEKKYGRIKTPKILLDAVEQIKRSQENQSISSSERPDYMG